MKKFLLTLLSFIIALQAFGQAKYIFVFIGDGMGANTINLTQFYKAAVDGNLGVSPLTMATFPVCNVANTYSLNSQITDSAASGTAIACGQKTNNSMLGMNPDGTRYTTIAELAKRSGKKVGIMTTVGANHATPAAFFGHQPSRGDYDPLINDMIADDFDFYAGKYLHRSGKGKKTIDDPEKLFTDNGYTIVGNNEQFNQVYKDAEKILFLPDGNHWIEVAIDRKEVDRAGHITLKDYVQGCIDFFMKDKCRKGFFIMAEGGEIDHFTHGNDAAGAIKEVIDMDEAIKVAYEFYLKHPKETAILVTSDHDTGGPGLNIKDVKHMSALQYQKYSVNSITSDLKDMMKEKGATPLTWEEVKKYLNDNLGLWDHINMNEEREAALRKVYDETIAINQTGDVSDSFGYNHNAEIVAAAVEILDNYAGVTWTTRSHSAAYVPVFYIGPQPELFSKRMDNTSFYEGLKAVGRYK